MQLFKSFVVACDEDAGDDAKSYEEAVALDAERAVDVNEFGGKI